MSISVNTMNFNSFIAQYSKPAQIVYGGNDSSVVPKKTYKFMPRLELSNIQKLKRKNLKIKTSKDYHSKSHNSRAMQNKHLFGNKAYKGIHARVSSVGSKLKQPIKGYDKLKLHKSFHKLNRLFHNNSTQNLPKNEILVENSQENQNKVKIIFSKNVEDESEHEESVKIKQPIDLNAQFMTNESIQTKRSNESNYTDNSLTVVNSFRINVSNEKIKNNNYN